MTYYLDTSVLVAALTNEAATEKVQTWLSEQKSEDLLISGWVITEFSSALSIKVRTGHLSVKHRAEALAMFNQLAADSLGSLPISGNHFRTAAQFADNHVHALRSGDALHLAVAGQRGATVCTLDRRLAESGMALGVSTMLL